MSTRRARTPKYTTPTANISLTLPTSLIELLDAEGYGQRSAATARILATHYNLNLTSAT